MDEQEQKARGERYLFVAPTNQAKNLLDDKAMTFDHLQGRLRDPRRLTRWAKSLRVVYADEVSMMQAEHWEVLNVLKRKFPTLRFILAGDWMQHDPVGYDGPSF